MTGTRPRALTPHLFVRDAPGAVAFYTEAFGACELVRNMLPNGVVLFVELAVGDCRLLLSEETPGLDALAPPSIGGTPLLLHLEVDDVDTVAERDPYGHRWAVSTAREQLTPDEVAERSPPEVPGC